MCSKWHDKQAESKRRPGCASELFRRRSTGIAVVVRFHHPMALSLDAKRDANEIVGPGVLQASVVRGYRRQTTINNTATRSGLSAGRPTVKCSPGAANKRANEPLTVAAVYPAHVGWCHL
ncbi:hypothetical protein MTO96_019164 [Rhipicephalus appendiculatus]